MLDKMLKNVESMSRNALSILDNPYVSTFVKVFLVVYAGVWAPRLPPTLAGLFQNNMFRMLIFFLVVFVTTKDARVALLIAVGFLMSMQALSLVNLPALPAPEAPKEEPEVEEVEAAIKRLNEKVEKIMNTNYVQERQKKIEEAQIQMMKSIKEASNTFFQVREVIRGKESLSNEEKEQYTEKLFHKILDKFMTKEEKDLFTRIISAGPMLMLSRGFSGESTKESNFLQLM